MASFKRYQLLRYVLLIRCQSVVFHSTGINKLYTLSYMWYTALGIVTTVVVGLIVSFISGNMTLYFI